jgi:hypothetical protein
MPFVVGNITIGATATRLATAVSAGSKSLPVAVQEIGFDPAIAHDAYIGDSNVSSSNYAIKLPASGTQPRTIGNGPSNVKIANLQDIYVLGTQNDVLHFYVVTL